MISLTLYYFPERYLLPGHVALKATDDRQEYWINFTHHTQSNSPARAMGWCVRETPRQISFNAPTKSIHELVDWHWKSNYFDPANHSLLRNNCAHAVRAVIEEFLGYDLGASDCVFTPLVCCLWAPTNIDTPRSIFMAVTQMVGRNKRAEISEVQSEDQPLLRGRSITI